jgi:hypothetical protein
MGPGIVIPLILVAIVAPLAFTWAKRLKDPPTSISGEPATAPATRLTSNALRELPTPVWRVVYEIADNKVSGIEHVLIGRAGAFAVQTSIEPLPEQPTEQPSPHAVAAAAITRGNLDDALKRCAMSTDRLVRVHWGAGPGGSIDVLPGLTAVDGRSLSSWAESLTEQTLTPAQVDLAWQTILVAIGRPDPLA